MIANRNSVQLDDTVPLMQVSNGLKKTKPKLQYQMGHDKNLQDITLGSDSAIPRRGESAAARPTPPHGVWIRKMGLFWVSSEVTRNPPSPALLPVPGKARGYAAALPPTWPLNPPLISVREGSAAPTDFPQSRSTTPKQ